MDDTRQYLGLKEETSYDWKQDDLLMNSRQSVAVKVNILHYIFVG